MDDSKNITPPPRPIAQPTPFTPPPRPPVPAPTPTPPVVPNQPARPITPPASIPVKESNLSNLSPSPAPHIPPTSKPPVIRTMSSDIGLKPAIVPPAAPKPAPRPFPSQMPPTAKPPTSSINIPPPPSSSGGSRMIWYIVAILILVMIAVVFFLIKKSGSEPTTSLTPTPTIRPVSSSPLPTAVPPGFESIMLPENSGQNDLNELARVQSVSIGEIKTFVTQSRLLTLPVDVSESLASDKAYFMIFGKPDGSKGRGFAYKINNPSALQTALAAWEVNMARDLKDQMQINTQRSASSGFLSNTYQNVLIKYRNFPDALNSIDFAIVTYPDDSQYLVFTNTRDHMFRVIDRAAASVLGK